MKSTLNGLKIGSVYSGIAKTCRSTRTAFASELGAQKPLMALESYY